MSTVMLLWSLAPLLDLSFNLQYTLTAMEKWPDHEGYYTRAHVAKVDSTIHFPDGLAQFFGHLRDRQCSVRLLLCLVINKGHLGGHKVECGEGPLWGRCIVGKMGGKSYINFPSIEICQRKSFGPVRKLINFQSHEDFTNILISKILINFLPNVEI